MGYRLLLIAATLLISVLLLSQYQADKASYRQEYEKAEAYYNAAASTTQTDSLALKHYQRTITLLSKGPKADSVLFDATVKAGILATSFQRDSLALAYFTAALQTQQKGNQLSDSLLFIPYLFAGNAQYNLFNYDTALALYSQAEKILDKYPAMPEAERLYNKTGVLYYESGDYKKSILYFRKALSIIEQSGPEKQYLVITYKNNIASVLRKSGNYEEALTLYKGLLQYNMTTDELRHNIGVTYLDAGNYEEAISWLKKVRYENAAKYNDLTKACLRKNDLVAAAKYLDLAMAMHGKTASRQKSIQYGLTLKYKGDLEMASQRPENALRNYQHAIIAMDPDFNDTSVTSNPASFNGLHQYYHLFDALVGKARAIKETDPGHKNPAVIKNALAAYRSAITLAAHVERSYESDEARLFLKKNADTVFHEFAGLNLDHYAISKDRADLQEAFNIIENNKASVLQADLHELALSNLAGLPQDLIGEQKRIKAELARLALLSGDEQRDSVQELKIRDLEISLSKLQEKLNRNPNYQRLKFSSKQVSVDSLQKTLSKDAAILSYYYIGEQLLCFYISPESFGYVLTPKSQLYNNQVLKLRQLLHTTATGDRNAVRNISADLYRQLLSPVLGQLSGKSRITIIPYNEISYIPFEMLADPETNDLLLKRFAISYSYSANFLGEPPPEKTSYGVLAFAPFTSTAAALDMPILKASENEVRSLPGEVILGGDATKQNFLASVGKFPIVHLATHAIANDAEPLQSFVAFYGKKEDSLVNKRLYGMEIYNLDLSHVKLVILSACETGDGQLVHGEGIMSLSRAFSYAGCKSAVASLWKADDQATAYITKQMHGYLKKGADKDIALQQAKIDYLENSEIDARYKTPAYWSNLILIGGSQSIVSKPWNWFVIILVILAFLAGILFGAKIAARK